MATHRKTEKERQLADGRRGGGRERVAEEPNHTIAQESLVLYKSFITLWGSQFHGEESHSYRRGVGGEGEGGKYIERGPRIFPFPLAPSPFPIGTGRERVRAR